MDEKTTKKFNSYLSFKLGDEIFAAHVSNVLNILEPSKITKVPHAPPYMKGVIDLRGAVLPLIDLRLKFGMPPTEFKTNTCILVLELNLDNKLIQVGALVDGVQEVLEIETGLLLPPPALGQSFKTDVIENMVKADENFVMILDMESIFSTDELQHLNQASKTEALQD